MRESGTPKRGAADGNPRKGTSRPGSPGSSGGPGGSGGSDGPNRPDSPTGYRDPENPSPPGKVSDSGSPGSPSNPAKPAPPDKTGKSDKPGKPSNPGDAAVQRVKAILEALADGALPNLLGKAKDLQSLMKDVESGKRTPTEAAQIIAEIAYTTIAVVTVLARLNGEPLPPGIAAVIPRLKTLMVRTGMIEAVSPARGSAEREAAAKKNARANASEGSDSVDAEVDDPARTR